MRFDVDIRKRVTAAGRVFDLDVAFCADSERLALFGPSGAGKSLTLQILAGLVAPDEGFVRVDGRTWFDSKRRIDVPARARRIGYVFQDYALFPHRTVEQNVAAALVSPILGRLHGAARREVGDLLEALALARLSDSYPAQLSGGERQRVALGRALARRPSALMLDEPFSALDAPLRSRVRAELLALHERFAVPYVLITHDAEDLATCADAVVTLAGGRVVAQAAVAADAPASSSSPTRGQSVGSRA